ncbi:hypothetical protein MKX01_008543 [Papaver californicum]|nr:hypothetical protein MKX01_008543 [Papaver californicum]
MLPFFLQIQCNDASDALLDPKDMTDIISCKKNYGIDDYGFLEEQNRRHTIQYGVPGGEC